MPPLQALNAIAPYDGRKDPDAWLNSIQAIADLYNWTDEQCLKIAKVRLTGPAWSWAQARQFTTWHAFQQQLESRYGETKESAIARLECCWQRSQESVTDFADRYLQNAEKAGRCEDEALVYSFIQRLHPDVKLEVARQRLHSIEEIVTFCSFWLGLLHGAEENMDPTDTHDEPWSFSHPYNHTCSLRRPSIKPREQGCNGAAYRAPPLRDNNAPGSASAHRADYMPQINLHWASPAPATAPIEAAIEELNQKLMRFELDAHCQMQKKDREIRTLRFALKKQREQQPNPAQINVMLPPCSTEDADTTPSDHEDDSRPVHKLPPSVFVQPTAGSKPQCTRALANCTTVRLAPPEAAKPFVASPLQDRAQAVRDAARRISPQRQPYNAAPYLAANKSAAAAAAGACPWATPPPNRLPDAAQLVDEKAKPMAADGMQEAILPPQAVLTTLVGHLAGDQAPINPGHTVAHCVNTLQRGRVQIPSTPEHSMRLVSSPVMPPYVHTQMLYMHPPVQPVQPAQVLPKFSTCKVMTATTSDYDREEVGIQINPPSAEVSSSSSAAANASACNTMEVTTPTTAPESPAGPTDISYVMWDTLPPSLSAQASCNCAATTDQPSQGNGMVHRDSFSDQWDPGLDADSDGRSAVVATLQRDRVVATPTTTNTVNTSHVLAWMYGCQAALPTVPGAPEPLSFHTEVEKADLLEHSMAGYTWLDPLAARMLADVDVVRLELAMDIEDTKSMQANITERLNDTEACLAVFTLMSLPTLLPCDTIQRDTDPPSLPQMLALGEADECGLPAKHNRADATALTSNATNNPSLILVQTNNYTVSPATADAPEPLPPLEAGRGEVLQYAMPRYTWLNPTAAHMVADCRFRQLEEGASPPATAHLPPLQLAFARGVHAGNTCSSEVCFDKHTTAAKQAALDDADNVPSAEPGCLPSLSSLRQEVAQMHQTVLTLFDPGGSYMPIDKQRISAVC
jgi:hypothetical protein